MNKIEKIFYFTKAYINTKILHIINIYFPIIFIKWRNYKLNKQLQFVTKNSPLYSELMKDSEKLKLEDFPIINKKFMMENINTLNTRKIDGKKLMELALKAEETRDFKGKFNDISYGLSSGTSGNRGIFLVSDKEAITWAGVMFAKLGHLRKKLFKKVRIAFFMRANNNLYETIGNRWFKFTFFDILKDFDENLKKLKKFDPTIIIAQPSVMSKLVKEYEGVSLQETFTIAEVLDSQVERNMKEKFNVKNYQIYQATEGFIGCTYKDQNLYVNCDIIYMEKEYINAEKTHFFPIITDLNRKTQPIIRYRLNDILVEDIDAKNKKYNFIPLKRIEGRSDEYFIFLNKNAQEIILFPDFIRNAVIKCSNSIKDYNVYQKTKNLIKVDIDSNKLEDIDKVKNSIEDLLNSKYINGIIIEVEIKVINRKKEDKLRRIFREI